MRISELQMRILGKMRLTPMTGDEIRQKVGLSMSPRAFSAALLRMRDRGLIDCAGMSPITYVTTPAGLGAFLDQERNA